MSILVGENGEKRKMNENEKIREYFLNTESRLPEDRPHDKVEFKSNVETMIATNYVFHQVVVAAGANEDSLLVNVEPLTANELTKLVTLVESMVGDKYKSRDEWGSMSDANRFLSGVMVKTTVFSNGNGARDNRHIHHHVHRSCSSSASGWEKAG
jgi:hypothetical protein